MAYYSYISVAHKFEDTELVRFLQKYKESKWILHTRQFCKAMYYKEIWNQIDVTHLIKNGDNMLMLFIRLGASPFCIKYLIQKGVDVNFVEPGGARTTPFFTACRYGNYDTIKKLLDAGADPTCRCATNESALEVAFNFCSEESFFLVYDAIFQKEPKENELFQYFSMMPPLFQYIIMKTHVDRNMLKIIYRVHKLLKKTSHMNPIQLGYSLEKLANYDDLGSIIYSLLLYGNEMNYFEIIHIVLRKLNCQQKTTEIWSGYCNALNVKSTPKILNLYVRYLCKLQVDILKGHR